MLRAEVYARALRTSQNLKRAVVWVGARCALRVGGAWASAEQEGTRMGWRDLWNRLAFFAWRLPVQDLCSAAQPCCVGGAGVESFSPEVETVHG
jgi:hypothetical protein